MENLLKLQTYNKETDSFLVHVQKTLNESKVELNLSLTDYVMFDNVKSNGCFLSGTPALSISVGKPIEKWLPVLVHEYSHFTQWKESAKVWMDLATGEENYIWEWIEGKSYPLDYIKTLIKKVRDMELDCEKRTVENIKKFNLPINYRLYVRASNAYICFYSYMLLKRKWYHIGREPYTNTKILLKMSNKFDMNYDKLDNELVKLYKECC